mgnify:CR=1 FL=1
MSDLSQLKEQLKETELAIGRCVDDDGIIIPSLRGKHYLSLIAESKRLNKLIKEAVDDKS